MFFHPSLVAPHPLVQPLASLIGTLIRVRGDTMRLEAHALPQMDGAVGAKLAVLLLDAHMAGRRASNIALDSLGDAILHITAQGLAEVEILSGHLYRHCPAREFVASTNPALPGRFCQVKPAQALTRLAKIRSNSTAGREASPLLRGCQTLWRWLFARESQLTPRT